MARIGKKTNNKEARIIYGIILLLIITTINLINTYYQNNKQNNQINDGNTEVVNTITAEESQNVVLTGDDRIQIHFFDVGQADSILLISNNKTMLIDAGTNEMRKYCCK